MKSFNRKQNYFNSKLYLEDYLTLNAKPLTTYLENKDEQYKLACCN